MSPPAALVVRDGAPRLLNTCFLAITSPRTFSLDGLLIADVASATLASNGLSTSGAGSHDGGVLSGSPPIKLQNERIAAIDKTSRPRGKLVAEQSKAFIM